MIFSLQKSSGSDSKITDKGVIRKLIAYALNPDSFHFFSSLQINEVKNKISIWHSPGNDHCMANNSNATCMVCKIYPLIIERLIYYPGYSGSRISFENTAIPMKPIKSAAN